MNESTGALKTIIAVMTMVIVALTAIVFVLFFRTQKTETTSNMQESSIEAPRQNLSSASPTDVIDRYYMAIRDRYFGIITDELATVQFANRLNNAISSGGMFEGKIANIGSNAQWQILEIKGVDYSNFQIALVQYTNENETNCERIEVADPGTTGDHWRIAQAYAVSCQGGEELVQEQNTIAADKTPTSAQDNTTIIVATAAPTATEEVGKEYNVPAISWSPCEISYSSRLIVGMAATVNNDPPVPNRIREAAGLQYKILGEMQPGEEMRILDGPKCADEWIWWKVSSLSSGLTGWTSEGTWDEYWLVPSRPPGY